MATNARFPITDAICIEARDAKLINCKEYIYDRHDAEDRRRGRIMQKVKCKCTLYMRSSWSGQSRVMAKQHVIQIGRHSICCGRMRVCLQTLPF